MKKLFLAVLICAIALGLMGCGKQAGTGGPGHEHPKSEHPK